VDPGRELGGEHSLLLLLQEAPTRGIEANVVLFGTRELVERQFTAERMVARTLEVYDQVLSRLDRHSLISA
jgi:hypothetical protein